VLDRSFILEEAGIDRSAVYLTNAVKHFHFEPRGKRRIHQKPELRHVAACHPWFDDELEAVQPRVVVAMGATAARAVLGKPVKIGESRVRLLDESGRPPMVTTHPSAVLRLRGKDGSRPGGPDADGTSLGLSPDARLDHAARGIAELEAASEASTSPGLIRVGCPAPPRSAPGGTRPRAPRGGSSRAMGRAARRTPPRGPIAR
jgi:hypothetical protein